MCVSPRVSDADCHTHPIPINKCCLVLTVVCYTVTRKCSPLTKPITAVSLLTVLTLCRPPACQTVLVHLQLAEWRQRKFDELNAPMADADKWVHSKVLQGHDRTFL